MIDPTKLPDNFYLAAAIGVQPMEEILAMYEISAEDAEELQANPPFSLFRQYVAQLVEHTKKFLIIGNTNATTYKEIFPLIKDNKMWLGCTNFNIGMFFEVPAHWEHFHHINQETGRKIARVSTSCWYTNLDHGRRHQPLHLMTMADNLRFSNNLRGKTAYDRYDNYDAIEVGTYKEIPNDYDGVMGVPITFLDKYNPDQFEILGITKTWHGGASKTYPMQTQVNKDGKESPVSKLNDGPAIKVSEPPTGQTYYRVGTDNFIQLYQRILIRHRTRPAKGKTT